MRSKVIERCKAKYPGLSDEAAVRKACADSSFFRGLWCFFDIELRMVVEPFMDWERGDVTLFLHLFPLMCMYVASSHKVKIPRVFLMIAERLKLYVDKHVNLIKLFASNCIQFDEEKIEFANAVIGRWMPARVKDINISHYFKVTCRMKCIRAIWSSFSKLFNRKEQENENERLRVMYTKQRWATSREETIDFILDLFDQALAGGYSENLWPRENPFSIGLMRIQNKYARELKDWNEKQVELGADSDSDSEDDDDYDDDDDDDDDDHNEGTNDVEILRQPLSFAGRPRRTHNFDDQHIINGFRQARHEKTTKAYDAAMKRFLNWCIENKDEEECVKDVLKTDDDGEIGFDFKKLASSCCVSVNAFTKYTLGLQVRYQSDLKSGMGEIKCLRSSLSKHLRANGVQLSTLGTQMLRDWMASRTNADMDAKMRDVNPIPLSHAKESLAFVAYEKLAGKLFKKDVFLWIVFVMQWNLLSRIINVCTMMWNRMDFVDDHLTISFAKTKKDQVGARRRIKRLFANPQNFKLCPITAIAIRLTQKDVKANHNLVYGSPKMHDTYCKGLRKFLASLDETESYKEFLGTHSLRK